ncbi:hypothetical protein [Sphingomicrobium astaxanthinifaciens]|uniref:hypothetical protein n=1 Tax=Sphingomicrobium astaxanthinifaciens TaxID=1227949 RepID=UPI001FCAE1AD|nr:hypothetical protein [Sphingomicrobium astaxanthinifaciens]MCJ7420908.1 hypothetical protein [Sphingomicrobium astaxanthinifaciens]
MRYFLDTEYDGFGGRLLSLALVPEDEGDEEFYVILAPAEAQSDWVGRNVIPYLHHVPEGLKEAPMSPGDAAHALAHYLAHDAAPEICADWPEDLAHFARLLVTGPGVMVRVPPFTLRLLDMTGFSTATNSAVPHNALHDARALREHVTKHLEGIDGAG